MKRNQKKQLKHLCLILTLLIKLFQSSTSSNKERRNDANLPTLFTDTANKYISWKNNCNMEEIPKSDLCSPSTTTANHSDSFCDFVSNSSHDENTEIHNIVEENVSEDNNISHQISNRAMESRKSRFSF